MKQTIHSRSRMLAARFAIWLAAAVAAPAFAATDTWDGGGADNNISTGLNWADNTAPLSDVLNTDLIFSGLTRLAPNFPASFAARSITFNNTAGVFALGGSTLTVGAGGIVNSGVNAQSFNNVVSLGSALTSFNAASGALSFNNTVAVGVNSLSLDGTGAFSFGNFTGTGTATKNGAGTMSYAPTTSQSLNLALGAGSVSTLADGSTDLFDGSAAIAVNGFSSLNFNENATLNGGQLTRASTGTVSIVNGKTLTVQGGGQLSVTGSYTVGSGNLTVNGAGSVVQTTNGLTLNGGAILSVLSGGVAAAGTFLDVGSSTAGTLTVDGFTSSATAAAGASFWGTNGGNANVTFSNGAAGSFASLEIARSAGGTASVQVLSGSSVSSNGNLLFAANTLGGTGTVTVSGSNSTWTQTGATTTTIGAASGSVATLNVQSGGTFNSGTATTTVNGTGTVAIVGGTFNANGNMVLNGHMSRDASGVFSLATGKTLTVQNGGDATFAGAYTTAANSTYTVAGAGSTLTAGTNLTISDGSILGVTGGGFASAISLLVQTTPGQTGTVTVDGAGSSLAATGTSDIGVGGGSANVTFSNGAAGSFSNLSVGFATTGNSGNLLIQSGADVTVANSFGIANSALGVTGVVTVIGAGSTLSHGTGSATFGGNSASVAAMNIQSGAIYSSSTGTTTVNATGAIVLTGGTYTSNGSLILNGGQLTRDGAGTLTFATGATMTVQNGGDAIITGLMQQLNRVNLVVSGSGSTFTTTGDFQWEGGNSTVSFLNISGGGSLTSGGSLHLARDNTAVSLTASGVGSQIAASPFFTSEWQAGVLLTNGANATLGGLRLADIPFGSSSFGSLTVQNGATASIGNLAAGSATTQATAEITIDGIGSQITQTAVSTLTLGAAFLSVASLSVNNSGAFTSGTGLFTLNPTGTVNIDGGTATFNGAIVDNGGIVSFTSGTLLFTNPAVNLTIGTGGLLGTDLALSSNRRLGIAGTTTIDATRTLTLSGGTLSTGVLVNNGTLSFNSGTLAITGAGGFNIGTGALGANVTLGTGAKLQVTNATAVAAGALLRIDGGSFTGGSITNNGTIDHRDGSLDFAGTLNNTSGGRLFVGGLASPSGPITNAGRITLQNGIGFLGGTGAITNTGVITGDGTIAKSLNNNATGQVRVDSGKTLTFTAGSVAPNAGTYALLGGTLEFTSAISNAATGFITGHGTLITAGLGNQGVMAFSGGNADIFGDVTNSPGARIVTSGAGTITTFYDDLVHNGLEIYTGAGASTVIFGSASGAGSYTGTGTVYFIGDLRPGNSPANVSYGGDLVLGPTSSLTLEIGGFAMGGEYDHLDIAGTLYADGVVTLALLGGFLPRVGDSFDLIDAGALAGDFDAIVAPQLAAGQRWDFAALKTTGAVTVVPEPGSAALALLGAAMLGLRCHRRRNSRHSTLILQP